MQQQTGQPVDLAELDLIDIKSLRRLLKVGQSQAEAIRHSGEIAVTMIGRRVLFTPQAVRDYIAAHTTPAENKPG